VAKGPSGTGAKGDARSKHAHARPRVHRTHEIEARAGGSPAPTCPKYPFPPLRRPRSLHPFLTHIFLPGKMGDPRRVMTMAPPHGHLVSPWTRRHVRIILERINSSSPSSCVSSSLRNSSNLLHAVRPVTSETPFSWRAAFQIFLTRPKHLHPISAETVRTRVAGGGGQARRRT
jgi:hypothetical protein